MGGVTQIILLILALAWTYLSGVGDFRPQQFDYFKHNLIFNNLVRFDWPVRYADDTYLCYYLAYYLPPALLAKWIGGVSMVHWYVFGWTWLGLTLLFGELYRLGGWGLLWLFVFFNSPESILLMYEGLQSPLPLAANLADLWNNDHAIELIFTSGGLTYPSHVESLSAVPQHAIGGWLATVLLIEKITKNDFMAKTDGLYLLGLCAVLLHWSPFVALGFLPFVAWYFYKILFVSTLKAPFFRSISFYFNLSTLILFSLPVLIYYAGHLPLHDPNDWLIAFLSTPHQYLLLATFLALEVVIWGVLLGLLERKHQILGKNAGLVALALGILLLLPFYRYGHFNDLSRRACLPATLVLCWAIFQFLGKIKSNFTHNKTLALLWICVFLGAILPLKHTLRWFTAHPYTAVVDKSIADLTPNTIHYLSRHHWGEFDVVAQYLGSNTATYSQVLAAGSLKKARKIEPAFYYWKSDFK